jgi:hypothetical protein
LGEGCSKSFTIAILLLPISPMASTRLTQGENISFGPNPFQTSFGLEIKTVDAESVRVIINNLQGSKLSDVMIDSDVPMLLGNDLMKGIYILQVVKRGKVSTYRIVKN